jgi:hypothetical protein
MHKERWWGWEDKEEEVNSYWMAITLCGELAYYRPLVKQSPL